MSNSDNEATGNLRRLGNVHHAAFRCRDAEQTRWFYEEVLGLPLAAAMVFDALPGTGKKSQYMHLFFELGDGNLLPFSTSQKVPPRNNSCVKIALMCT